MSAIPLGGREPVLLLAHGTRDERGRAELRALRDAVQRGRDAPVAVGVVEYPAPGLEPAFTALARVAEAARTGCGTARVAPLLLFPAGHAHDDLRVVLRGGRLLHPAVRITSVPLLRPGSALLDAALGRLHEAEAEDGRAGAVLVAGRGTSCAHANEVLARRVAAPLAARAGRPVGHAFASLAEPSVAEGLALLEAGGARHVTVVPYLLNDGRIARRIAAEARTAGAALGLRITVAGHLGLHPRVVEYVRARADGYRGCDGVADGAARDAPLITAVRPVSLSAAVPRRRFPRPIVVAGTASGAGKTTVALGLMAALRARGLRVQPFKVGPDFIDPLHHGAVAGRPSRNLDGVLCDPRMLPALAARAMRDADVAIVEGVLGLFDGRLGGADSGSTAEVARMIGGAVLLVVDAGRSARSTAAVALGFARFDPDLQLAGVILNRVGSERHLDAARTAVEAATGLPVLGALPRDPGLTLPERYLGLIPPQESPAPPGWADSLAAATERHLDLERVLRLASAGPGPVADPAHDPFAAPPLPPRARIAVARDVAFSFQYLDALDLLVARGAELVPFSPLGDRALPACGAVLLGGGFPERFAAALAANTPMRASVAAAAARGVPIVAECGGAMYLGRWIVSEDGDRHPMAGVLPYGTRMEARRRALGYRTATALRATALTPARAVVTGHEFHWSAPDPHIDTDRAAWRLAETGGTLDGFAGGGVVAGYVHVHLCGVPGAAERLVGAAERAEAPSGRDAAPPTPAGAGT